MLNNFLKKFLIVSGLFIILALPVLAFAQTQISVGIPGTNSNGTAAAPGAFVDNFYQFAFMIGGILAFGAIVFGGVKYMASAGNPSGQSDAKEWIWGALTGLLLLAGAYLILHVVNPQLVNLNINPLQPTNSNAGTPTSYPGTQITYGCTAADGAVACSPGNKSDCSDVPNGACSGKPCGQVALASCGMLPTTGACSIPALPTLSDQQSISMESGSQIQWTSSDPGVQANLNLLKAAYTKFQALMSSKGESYSLNSVYRPFQYQTLLYALYHDATQYGVYGCQASGGGGSSVCPAPITAYSNNPSCASVISAIQKEENNHGVCKTSSPCLVGAPSLCGGSPHVTGIGIDINLNSGPVTFSNVNSVLSQNNVPLQWQSLSTSDPVHFNLQGGNSCPN